MYPEEAPSVSPETTVAPMLEDEEDSPARPAITQLVSSKYESIVSLYCSSGLQKETIFSSIKGKQALSKVLGLSPPISISLGLFIDGNRISSMISKYKWIFIFIIII